MLKKPLISYFSNFKKFLECFINNLSLPRTAEICKISLSCAFNWRHKILAILNADQENTQVSGLIEMDEIYFRNSQKGNFSQGIGRKARTHGYCPNFEDPAGLSKKKVCVSTAIDRDKNIVSDFVGFGKPNSKSLINVYKNRVLNIEQSKFITDGETSYKLFAKGIGADLKVLKKDKNQNKRLPVIKGKYHIQNVNSFHSQIKDVLDNKFKGVSTKYLLKYINWVKWLRLNKDNFYLMVEKL